MKYTRLLPIMALIPALTGCAAEGGTSSGILPWLFGFCGLACLALAVLQTYSYIQYVERARRKRRRPKSIPPVTLILYGAAVILCVLALFRPNTDVQKDPAQTSTATTTETTVPTPTTGWIEKDGVLRYWVGEDEYATGWQDIDGKRYYFDSEGLTLSGWQEIEGMNRYFRADGSMARGEEIIDGEKYFFTSTGAQIDVANPWNAVPEGYEVELMDLSVIYATKGIKIDVRIWEPLKKMMDACNKDMAAQYSKNAPRCCVTSGYRSFDDQTQIYNNKVNNLVAKGYDRQAAEAEAATAVAVPGTSEHQLGLAVDIVDTGSWGLTEFQADLPAQQWLMEHCWEYGFILRYPEGKTDVTGIIYEPWHYRYVGTELSLELRDLDLTLEEYLDSLD